MTIPTYSVALTGRTTGDVLTTVEDFARTYYNGNGELAWDSASGDAGAWDYDEGGVAHTSGEKWIVYDGTTAMADEGRLLARVVENNWHGVLIHALNTGTGSASADGYRVRRDNSSTHSVSKKTNNGTSTLDTFVPAGLAGTYSWFEVLVNEDADGHVWIASKVWGEGSQPPGSAQSRVQDASSPWSGSSYQQGLYTFGYTAGEGSLQEFEWTDQAEPEYRLVAWDHQSAANGSSTLDVAASCDDGDLLLYCLTVADGDAVATGAAEGVPTGFTSLVSLTTDAGLHQYWSYAVQSGIPTANGSDFAREVRAPTIGDADDCATAHLWVIRGSGISGSDISYETGTNANPSSIAVSADGVAVALAARADTTIPSFTGGAFDVEYDETETDTNNVSTTAGHIEYLAGGTAAPTFDGGIYRVLVVVQPSAASPITVTPTAASVALTAPSVSADVAGATLTPTAASVALTAPSVALAGAATVAPTAAALALTAPTVAVSGAASVAPTAASLVLTAPSVATANSPTTAPTAGTVTLTAPAPSVLAGAAEVTPTAAALVLSAPSVTVDTGAPTVAPTAGSLALTAPSVALAGPASVAPTAAAVALSAPAVAASTGGQVLLPTAATVALTAPSVALAGAATLAPTTVALALSAPAVALQGAAAVAPTSGLVALTAPSVTTDTGTPTTSPDPATLTLTAPAPTVVAGATAVAPTAVELGLTAPGVTIVAGALLAPTALALALTAPDPTVVAAGAELAPTAAELQLLAGTVAVSTGGQVLLPTAVALALAVPDVALLAPALLQPDAQVLTLTAPDVATLAAAVSLQPDAVVVALAVGTVSIVQGLTAPPPANAVFVAVLDNGRRVVVLADNGRRAATLADNGRRVAQL